MDQGQFNWDDVINNIAAMVEPELEHLHIKIQNTAPDLDSECPLPIVFPSRSPSVGVQRVSRFNFAISPTMGFRGTSEYVINFVYLHIALSQPLNFNPSQYEGAIRRNLAAIFRALIRHSRTFGVAECLPDSAAIDDDLQSPKGKSYMGATFSVRVKEINELLTPSYPATTSDDNAILQENGDPILLEMGDPILVE